MHRFALGLVFALSSLFAVAQTEPPAAPAPTGLIVGSGNFFSPIVADLDKAVAFYGGVLGFEIAAPPADASANPALRNMFGLPDARLRWQVARAPGIAGGVEIIEIADAGGRPLARRMQDPGAFTLLVIVRDMSGIVQRLKAAGTPILTVGGAPASVPMGANAPPAKLLMVQDPDGHFVEIVELGAAPPSDSATPPNIVEVRVRLTVADVERAVRLYRDTLGMESMAVSEFNDSVANALGVPGSRYRFGMFRVPGSGLVFEVMEFAGVQRETLAGRIQDPGSTRIQLRVRDVDDTIAALAPLGGAVVSTGGQPLELPAGQRTLKVAIVREPDNLFLVLIETPPPAP
jgi:catechol 2,3-dioxygenase-like lactoylglutathione lyase family enzyme